MLQPYERKGKPHWQTWLANKDDWKYFENFQEFLKLVWKHLSLPPPTEAQLEIAHRLQHGRDSSQPESEGKVYAKKDIIRGFRAIGKSYITAAFVVWLLMRNPRNEKVLVVSATHDKAKDFVKQTKGIKEGLSICSWLLSGKAEDGIVRRDTADEYDVSLASNSQSHSVQSKAVKGQITGKRATTIIGDDMEIQENSQTEQKRAELLDKIREFQNIANTEDGVGDIILLGTPQTEESIYNAAVIELGFSSFTLPVRFPKHDKLNNYVLEVNNEAGGGRINILAPYLIKKHTLGELDYWQKTDTRFDEDYLVDREKTGKAQFALQYMLDTSLTDEERYPLKQRDLLVYPCLPDKAPLTMSYGKGTQGENIIKNIPNRGFSNDFLMRPFHTDSDFGRYEYICGFVDPSGQGLDETAMAVGGVLNGLIYILDVVGARGNVEEGQIQLAQAVKKWKVSGVWVEPNYGGQVYSLSLHNVFRNMGLNCTITEADWSNTQKEVRIIDTLEPALTSHRIVMDEGLVIHEAQRGDKEYSLLYQLTHITRDRGCLKRDDKLDALAGLIYQLQKLLSMNKTEAVAAYKENQLKRELQVMRSMAHTRFAPSVHKDFSTGETTPVFRFRLG